MLNFKKVKPDDPVWVIECDPDCPERTDVNEAPYMLVTANDQCVIVAQHPIGLRSGISQYLIKETRKSRRFGTMVFVFPHEDVFSSLEEARSTISGGTEW